MIKKYIGVSVSLLILMAPAGLALADDGGDSHTASPDASVSEQVHLQDSTGEDAHGDDGAQFHTAAHGGINGSTTMPWSNGEKNGLIKHFGTTTPPGIARHEEGTSSEDAASSTNDHQEPAFHASSPFFSLVHWIMGLSSTTTTGDFQATIAASTTASTTIPVQEGFFQKFMHFFHFGSNN